MCSLSRKCTYFFSFITILFITFFAPNTAQANSTVSGTFVSVQYDEVQFGKDQVEKRLSSITIKNKQGRMTTFNIDKYASLYVDTISVSIEAFKLGMEIEADVNLRRVKTLHGKTGTVPGEIEHNGKIVEGTVNRIDKGGNYISVKIANGQIKTFYLNTKTEIYKGTTLVDLSLLYEGDHVKLGFSEYDTNLLTSIEINVQGVKIESLYKGTIQRIDPISNKIILRDQKIFLDWKWQTINPKSNSTYTYSNKKPIYVGNQPIKSDRLRYYANHEVYLVTISQFGQEIVEKMVIKIAKERTFTEPMKSINTKVKSIEFINAGKINYHDGSILIRNGRLVDASSLQVSGTAFVVTEGMNRSDFANVVHIANDGFQSPNLTNHGLYFGQIQTTTPYNLTLNNLRQLDNNYWKDRADSSFTFSNDTNAVYDFKTSVLDIIARDEMDDYYNRNGYFYVSNGNIIALHLPDPKASLANIVSVGRLQSIKPNNPAILSVRNVSQWQSGAWAEAGNISSLNIEQATLIKDGKVIQAKDLRIDDRLYIIHESQVKGRIILVN